jgi:DNA invertase Pin-like site-specific DNA recombinase
MKAVIYARTASEMQELKGSSLENQVQSCVKYAQEKSYTVVRTFKDLGSGLSQHRENLWEMLEYIGDNKVDKLVVYSFDRLARDSTQLTLLRSELTKRGVQIVSVTESNYNNTDPVNRLTESILAAFAQQENEFRRERIIRGIRAARERKALAKV